MSIYIVFIPEPKCRQIWILMFYSFLIVLDLIGRLSAWKGDNQPIKDFFPMDRIADLTFLLNFICAYYQKCES